MKDYIQKQPFFFMIGLYGLMSGLIIAMGRIEMGLQMSHSGRYITISKFFVLGVLGFIAYEDIKPKKYFVALIIILISYAYIRDFGLSYSAKESKKKSVIEFENVQLFQEFSYKENATTYKDIHFIFENKLSCFYSIKKPNKLPVNKKL